MRTMTATMTMITMIKVNVWWVAARVVVVRLILSLYWCVLGWDDDLEVGAGRLYGGYCC